MDDNNVIIEDITMPFKSMVIFGLKWMLALIPAIILFYLIILLLIGIFGFIGLGLGLSAFL